MKRITPLAVAVAAATAAAEPLPMEHVLVSVPLHKQEAETALPVTVLSGDELTREVAGTIGETLSNKPGLANASFGPGVGQPVIRGQQGPRVTVLQNGTSSADASNISADHAVAVEPLLADSIEVLRGPATLLYGGGAIGGVVNIIDNRIPTALPAEASGDFEYRHDTAASLDNVVARGQAAAGNFALYADALYRDWDNLEIPGQAVREDEHAHGEEEHAEQEEGGDGEIENTAGRTKSLTLGSSYHFASGFFGLAVNRLENNYGIPAGAHGAHGDEHDEENEEHEAEHEEEHEEEHGHGDISIELEQTRYDAALHVHQPFTGMEVFRGFLTYTDYEHAEIEGSGEVGTVYENETWEGRLELVHQPLGNFHGVLGLQLVDSEFSAEGEEAFIPLTGREGLGVFLVEDYHADNWLFELGLRFDRDELSPDSAAAADESFDAFSVSGSALWNVTGAWQLGLALSRAERAPSTEELYSNVENDHADEWVEHAATGAIELGNTELEVETSNNVDVSVDWRNENHHAAITLFYNDFEDYIGLLATGMEVDEVPVYVYHQQDAEFYGVEIDTEFGLATVGAGDLRLGIYGDSIRGELDDGNDVPRMPPLRLGARLSWQSDQWRLWGGVLDAADQDRPGVNEDETEGYTRWDAGIEYRLQTSAWDLLAFARFNNITDEEIRLSTSFLREVAPEAGRGVEFGVRYSF
ncbi:TonB-dependent receptor [Seongchinamella sediminis]|uniref:TonB-dependent receptor n=1 Tax=Seongchinamella sediminis TaxID=2283635 RepID=A0A3L7E4D8_9GAMM|nr:TonB-dependent receptor [Seongchinamella sediminis]RLQ23433.1 TonB-dependent receptor [Seongchinamella sediminis]